MSAFQRGGGFNKRQGPGGPRGGSFGGPRPFNRDAGAGRGERFTATCADCGDTCEVPFRPNGKKPVYCKACFPKHQDEGRGERGFDRRPSAPRFDRSAPRFERRAAQFGAPTQRPAAPVSAPDHRIDTLVRDVSALNAKLDTLAELVRSLSSVHAPVGEPAKKIAKKAAKKIAKKK